MKKILELDRIKKQVRVQGGVNLYRLSLELAKIGLQLPTQPGPYDATVTGLTSGTTYTFYVMTVIENYTPPPIPPQAVLGFESNPSLLSLPITIN